MVILAATGASYVELSATRMHASDEFFNTYLTHIIVKVVSSVSAATVSFDVQSKKVIGVRGLIEGEGATKPNTVYAVHLLGLIAKMNANTSPGTRAGDASNWRRFYLLACQATHKCIAQPYFRCF
jgi:hypothetical protein